MTSSSRPSSPPRLRATVTPASPEPLRAPSPALVASSGREQSISRSPSTSRRASASSTRDEGGSLSASSALAQAGFGLLAVPRSPRESAEEQGSASDAGWPTGGLESGRSSAVSLSSVDGAGAAEDDRAARLDGKGLPRARKISFGTLLERASNASGGQHASTSKAAEPTPRKLSGPQRFIKRARSFGQLGSTSPVLPSSPSFAPSNASSSHLPPSPIPSPPLNSMDPAPRRPSSSAKGKDVEVASPIAEPSPSPSLNWLFQPVVQSQSTKGKEKVVDQEGTGVPGGRRKSTLALRRSTFSIFRRNDSHQHASEPSTPVVSETPSPPTSSVPPLPSLPSLQLSGTPYRMSWGFGNGHAPIATSAPTPPPSSDRALADVPLTASPLGSPTRSLRPQTPPIRRAASADSPTLRRNGSWASSQRGSVIASSSSDYAALGLWLERNGSSVAASPPARKLLTRAGRSNSDGLTRNYSLGSLPSLNADGWRRVPRSPSGSTIGTGSAGEGASTPSMPPVRPPSPLKMSSSVSTSGTGRSSGGLGRRPTTAGSLTDSGREGRGGVFGAVSGFFGGGSSSNMSRSSSNSSAVTTPHVETSEFGALFGGSPAKGRKRGLSVGNGIFGSSSIDSRKRAGSSSSLSNSWVPPTGGLLVPTPDGGTTPTGNFTRGRASTDPRRLSSSSYDPQGSYFPPHTSTSPSRGHYLPPPSPQFALPSPPESPGESRRPSSALSRPSTSPSMSRKTSFNQQQQPQGRSRSSSVKVDVEEGETPEAFVQRLLGTVSKGDVSRVCASSSDPFFATALTAYLATFDFASDPLDIALRKFLMEASLPTETQQIDRVMEAFAIRYNLCNPGLFTSSDTPYVLAFSLVMLSTDQFNPSNKNKMSRADYVRNTRIEGVATEVLEYLFDQITITPFVFVEDANDFGVLRPEMYTSSGSFFSKSTSSSSARSKFDPYHLISMGTTRDLRLDVESLIPPRSPFSFTGTTSFFNATTLHQLFAQAPVLQITSRPRSKSSVGPLANSTDGAPLEPTTSNMTFVQPPKEKMPTISSLKITKIGLLSRKEDLAEGGKKAASRKWKGWSVVLTGSQLLFFKDPNWAEMLQQTLHAAAASQSRPDDSQVLVFSIQTPFKPDAVLSLANSAAIYDATYAKYSNVFRLVAPAGRQYLFQTETPAELNSWLHAINYAASFKSANLRMRPPTLKVRSSDPPATSLPSAPPSPRPADLPLPPSPSPQSWSMAGSLASSTSTNGSTPSPAEGLQRNLSPVSEEDPSLPASLRPSLSSEALKERAAISPEPVVVLAGVQSKGEGRHEGEASAVESLETPKLGQEAFKSLGPNRGDLLRARIGALEDEIRTAKSYLQSDLRLARNFAVLTPFRASTKERIQLALQPLEKRVRHARMNLAKLVCHREVLSRDLLVEDRESRPARHGSHRRRNSSRPSSPSQNTPRPSNQQWPSPLRVPERSRADSDPRDSFDSAPEHLPRESVSDDELDRLRAAPPLQRSQTETLWSSSNCQRAASGVSEDELPPTRPLLPSPSGSANSPRPSPAPSPGESSGARLMSWDQGVEGEGRPRRSAENRKGSLTEYTGYTL